MIRLVALDLDGTLLSDDKTVCEKNRMALRKAVDAGVKVVLCSGRSQQSLAVLMKDLELDKPGQYGIALNGAVVFEADTGNVLAVEHMDPEDAEVLLTIGEPLMDELNIQVYDDEHIYVKRWDETTDFYEKVTYTTPVLVDDLNEKTKKTIKVSFFQKCEGEPQVKAPLDRILELKGRIEKDVPENLSASVSAPYLIEFMNRTVHKGVGMAKMGEILGIDASEMMAVGDLENDLGMLNYAGTSVAMKNGSPAVKEAARYETTLTNNEGGVAEAIERFVFNE